MGLEGCQVVSRLSPVRAIEIHQKRIVSIEKDLAGMEDKTWIKAARGRAIKVISHLLKDLPPDNNYQVLFIRREMDEILEVARERELGNIPGSLAAAE